MIGAMQELRTATVAHNIELETEIGLVRSRRAAADAFLDAETHEREAQFDAIKRQVEQACQEAEAEVSSTLSAAFQRNADTIPALGARLDTTSSKEQKFYFTTVPSVNEKMCGELIRTMQSHKEALQLDAAAVSNSPSPNRAVVSMSGSAAQPSCLIHLEELSNCMLLLLLQPPSSASVRRRA
jgi:hypothetical protein